MLQDHLEKLRAFHITSSEQSLLKAALKLGVTQPAVTKSVKLLEEELETKLFVRHSRGVTLTPKGAILNEFCESLFLRVRDIEKQLRSHDALSGVIRIGTYETLGELFWPAALTELHRVMPGVTVELTTEHPEGHWAKLESGALDMIVDAEPRVLEKFYTRSLYNDSFGIFCKKGSRWFHHQGPIPIAFVKRAVDRKNTTIEQHLAQMEGQFNLQFSVESFTMVRALVAEGVCVGVLPLRLARAPLKDGQIVQFAAYGKNFNFGEHRICVTYVHDLKDDYRIKKITEILKTAADHDKK